MSPRPDVSVERRNQILDTAAAVFAQHGFNQARIDDIAREAQLSKGAIYWYFKSKDEIILALMQRFFDQELREVTALLEAETPVGERLLWLNQKLTDDVLQIEAQGLLPLFYEFYTLATRHDPVQQFFQTYFRSYREVLTALMQQGIARGEFRPSDPGASAITLTAVYEGLILLWTIDSQSFDLAAQAQAAMQMMLNDLLVQSDLT